MDHRYIDENSVAERYLEHALSPDVHDVFESHLVDCEECADRLLLAQIFLEHRRPQQAAFDKNATLAILPKRAQFVAHLRPWQLLALAILAATALLAVPTAYFLGELLRLSHAH